MNWAAKAGQALGLHPTRAAAPAPGPRRYAAGLVALHLMLALLFTFAVFPHLGEGTSGLDPDGYGSAGEAWYLSGRFEPLNKAPLYPGFVALTAWLMGGYSIPAVQVGQALLSALACGVLYALFRRTLPCEPAARWAALACALYPMTLWYIPRLWTETWLTLILALYTLAFTALLQRPSLRRALLAGAVTGLLALSKGIALVFVPLSLLLLWLCLPRRAAFDRAVPGGEVKPLGDKPRPAQPARWQLALVFTVAALVFVAPWTVRNLALSGRFLPIHTDGGYNFYLGNGFTRYWAEAPLSYVDLKARTVGDMDALFAQHGGAPADVLDQDALLLRAGLADLAAQPGLALRKLLLGSLSFWYLAGDWKKSLLTGALQLPVLLLALPGVWLALRAGWRSRFRPTGASAWGWAWLLLLPVAGIFAVSISVFSFARLAAPVMPYLLALNAAWLLEAVNRHSKATQAA